MKDEPTWVSSELAEAIHREQLREHGGSDGIRDGNLFESALARPQQKWAYEPSADIYALGAAYAYGIARNHPFIDGNKRTAFTSMAVFLYRNGHLLEVGEPEAVVTMLALASGEMPEEDYASWIRTHVVPL